MLARLCLTAAVLICAAGVAPARAHEARSHFDNVTIASSTGAPSFDSGIVAAWVRFEIALPSEKHVDVYVPAMSHDEIFPEIGSVCSMITEEQNIVGGSTNAGHIDHETPVLIASVLRCSDRDYPYRG
ncbi:MAG: hypothetical protein WDM79_06115 [Terricaulis sp.]